MQMNKNGRFIVFEGLDGCGKSTQLENLYRRLQALCKPAQKRKIFVTREPSDSVPGSLCRGIGKRSVLVQSETEALLYAADRYEHIKMELLPQLKVGNHILCDRYYFSNFAYQSADSDINDILAYNRAAMDMLRADVTIFLDVSPEECEKRRASERAGEEKYENIEFARKAKERYFKAFELLKKQENILIVNGTGDPGEIFENLWKVLSDAILNENDYK
jgi:dTMP kinase